jgi:hypothetical protein
MSTYLIPLIWYQTAKIVEYTPSTMGTMVRRQFATLTVESEVTRFHFQHSLLRYSHAGRKFKDTGTSYPAS